MWWLGVVAGVMLAMPAEAAGAYTARVRWQPTSDPGVTGYRIYRRTLSSSYGAPQDAGMPAAGPDGSLTALVNSLDVRTDYAFVVTAYTASQSESGHSNEMQLGYAQVAPLVDSDGDGLRDAAEDVNLNRVRDPGETDPNNPDSDGDGVRDGQDSCQGTVAGAAVNPSGCSCAQVTCGNGNACDGVETCVAGVCGAGTPPNCDDGNACTTDACSATTGCTHAPISGCTACTTVSQCNDNNPCTTDVCSAGRCQRSTVANGTTCTDGNQCNGAETCQAGTCSAGTPLSCDDGNACTTDTCSAVSGCAHAPISGCTACTSANQCEDSNPCTTDVCTAGRCQRSTVANGTACSDGNQCNGAETCQAGSCSTGPPLNCNDANACTTDTCGPGSGCAHAPISGCTPCSGVSQCEDGNPCTTDTCSAGRCQRSTAANGTACSDGNQCNGAETCQTGTCRPGISLNCDDANACTTDTCSAANGCGNATIPGCTACTSASQCNDNNPCTTDLCTAGRCERNAVTNGTACSDGNQCNGAETCQTGACRTGPVLDCDDANACTTDTCSPASGCAHGVISGCTPCTGAAQCDDRNPCNGVETCTAGTCSAGASPSCNDGNACTTDACDTTTGCTHAPITGCSSCTTTSQCDDSNPCTRETCTAGRCERSPIPDDTACSDGNPCNGAETCRAATCTPSPPLTCDDGDACTIDACAATSGCTHAPIPACTSCSANGECDDRNPCTTDACTQGVCARTNNAASCDDGIACTGGDVCAGGSCTGVSSCPGGQDCNHGSGLCELPAAGLAPVADTYIDSTQPTQGMGRAEQLMVHAGPSRVTYLKFDLGTATAPIKAATLNLHCTNASNDGGAIYLVPDSGWGEDAQSTALPVRGPLTWLDVDTNLDGTITGSDSSPFVPDFTKLLGSLGTVRIGETYSVDLTAALQNGPTVYTFAIVNAGTDAAGYASRERPTADQQPRLHLEFDVPELCVADAGCDDGNPCNGAETCQSGICTAGERPSCDDGKPCTTDRCDESSGCVHAPISGCAACASATECDDRSPCTTDVCSGGRCEYAPTDDGLECGDGNPCNGAETCRAGVCKSDGPLSCDDGDACTIDACSPSPGCMHVSILNCTACSNPAQCDDGNPCTTEACRAGRCERATLPDTTSCSDGNACNGAEACQAGVCTPGGERRCDDGNACTVDSCDPSTGCTHAAISGCTGCRNDSECVDSSPCTRDTCNAGRCEHPPVTDGAACSDGNTCNGDEMCQAGACKTGTPLSCDDKDSCTTDGCSPASGCTHAPLSNCTPCSGTEECDDGNPCTAEVCADGRCQRTNRVDGSSCSDGDACTGREVCRAGLCVPGQRPDCNDANVCTTDSCDPATGCSHVALVDCKACRTATQCNDRNRCTRDVCSAGRCQHAALADGLSCNDGNACNGADACRAGVCLTVGVPRDCDDNNACTVDYCNEARGQCTHEGLPDCCATDGDCRDTDDCSVNERCVDGTCEGDSLECPDVSECTEAICDARRGCGVTPLPDGTLCDDNDPCTQDEVCNVGVCGPGRRPTGSTTTTSPQLDVREFSLKRINQNVWRLNARGWFAGPGATRLMTDGLTIELLDTTGSPLYSVTIPGSSFRRGTGRVVYWDSGSTPYEGVRRIEAREEDGGVLVTLIARVPAEVAVPVEAEPLLMAGARRSSTSNLMWVLSFGDECVRNQYLTCPGDRTHFKRCK